MKIDAFIFCYNESNMIRHTLNHYSRFCDQITILDNHSDDNCISIIKKEYKDVIIRKFETNNQCREDIQTNLKNNCWKNSTADYVIVCDMDEFLYSENMDLELKKLEKYKPSICSCIGYEMFSDNFPGQYNQLIFEQVKLGVRNYRFDKTIIFSPKDITEINYDFGAHSCRPKLKTKHTKDYLVEFKLLHYKYLDKKIVIDRHKNYVNRLSNINIFKLWGKEYLQGRKHINKMFRKAQKHSFKVIP